MFSDVTSAMLCSLQGRHLLSLRGAGVFVLKQGLTGSQFSIRGIG